MSESRALLRHMVATVAYRGGKAIRNVDPHFAEYGSPQTSAYSRKNSRAHWRPDGLGSRYVRGAA